MGLLVLLACQLAGECVVRLLGVPLPGPVAGMVILLVVLTLREPAAGSRTAWFSSFPKGTRAKRRNSSF